MSAASTSRVLLEDRSDTWSVDAMPSDEEDSANNAAPARRAAIARADDLDEADVLGETLASTSTHS